MYAKSISKNSSKKAWLQNFHRAKAMYCFINCDVSY